MNTTSIIIAVIFGLMVLGAVLGPILAHRRHAAELQAQFVIKQV